MGGPFEMMEFLDRIQDIDRHVTLAINQCYSPFTDEIWKIFSNREIWYVLYLLVAIALVRRLGWKKGLVAILSVILTIVACDQCGNLVKNSVARFRPTWDSWMMRNDLHILLGRHGYYGFYSAHAANAMGFAVGSARCFKWDGKKHRAYTWAIVIWGVLVGLSRIFAGAHFAGDVIVGLLVGTLFGCIFAFLGKKIIDKFVICG